MNRRYVIKYDEDVSDKFGKLYKRMIKGEWQGFKPHQVKSAFLDENLNLIVKYQRVENKRIIREKTELVAIAKDFWVVECFENGVKEVERELTWRDFDEKV